MIKKSNINYKGIITLFVLLIAFISLFFVNVNQIRVSADSTEPPYAYDDLVETHETISVNSCDFVLDVHEDGNITFKQTFEVTFVPLKGHPW